MASGTNSVAATINVPPSESNCVPFRAKKGDISLGFKGQPEGYPFRLSENYAYPFRLSVCQCRPTPAFPIHSGLPSEPRFPSRILASAPSATKDNAAQIVSDEQVRLILPSQERPRWWNRGQSILARAGEFLRGCNNDYTEVDEIVFPLVAAMNATGLIKTIASCQGHATGKREPYVYFSASAGIVALIRRELKVAAMPPKAPLHTAWMIKEVRRSDTEVAYRLYAPEYDALSRTFPGAILRFLLLRQRLDSDLLRLVEVMKNGVRPYARKYRN